MKPGVISDGFQMTSSWSSEIHLKPGVISDGFQMTSYWYTRTDEEGAGPTYVVGRGDEEITHPCLFRHEAQAIVDALNKLSTQGDQP